MGLKSNDSCLQKAGEGEPIFVLLARDRFAPTLVRIWVDLVSAVRIGPGVGAVPKDLAAKLNEALDVANQMDHWQAKHGCKIPD